MIIAGAQISPIWCNKKLTTEKIVSFIEQASKENAALVAFGEGLLPGYPFWLDHTGGAAFDDIYQKAMHAHYMQSAITIEAGELKSIQSVCRDRKISAYVGIIERPDDRGSHSLYGSLVYISQAGTIESVQRKLMPTYEERLAWSIGDGHGLRTHAIGDFTVGGLSCWENWMPLARASLYAQGENLHVATWPGNPRNTSDITPHMAKEGRSYVLSVSGLMTIEDYPESTPGLDCIKKTAPESMALGGSCIAAPDGSWLVEPVGSDEQIITAEIHLEKVFEERQNFDPSGHYSRPDVFDLRVNRQRQRLITLKDA